MEFRKTRGDLHCADRVDGRNRRACAGQPCPRKAQHGANMPAASTAHARDLREAASCEAPATDGNLLNPAPFVAVTLNAPPLDRARRWEVGCLRRQLFRWFLQVGRVELRKIASYALFQLGAASLHLPAREVLVAVLTALNLLPSIATLAMVSRPIRRHSSTNCTQTCLIAGPLSLRKSAIVL